MSYRKVNETAVVEIYMNTEAIMVATKEYTVTTADILSNIGTTMDLKLLRRRWEFFLPSLY